MWNIPPNIGNILKKFSGEIAPDISTPRDHRRMFFDEMSASDQEEVLQFFIKNKILVVSDILKGTGEFSADWTLVILKLPTEVKWALKSINHVMNIFGAGKVRFTRE